MGITHPPIRKLPDHEWLLARLGQEFPGLLDTETDVNGGDLVDWLTHQLQEMDELRAWIKHYQHQER